MLGVKLMVAAVVYTLTCAVLSILFRLFCAAYYSLTGKSTQLALQEFAYRYVLEVPTVCLIASLVAACFTVIVSLVVLPIFAALSRSSVGAWLPDRPGMIAGGCVATLTIAPLWLASWLLPTVPSLLEITQALVVALVAIVVSQTAGALAAPADVLRVTKLQTRLPSRRFGLIQLMAAMTGIAIPLGLAVSLPRMWTACGGLLLYSAIAQALTRPLVWQWTKHLLQRRFERRRAQRLAARST